jgi:polyribonucleotide nucleotidyltransferase
MKKIEKSVEIGGEELELTTGHVAMQASGAVMAKYGETVVLATVVAEPMRKDLGYFPLTVEYQERLYAGGRIKGSRWVKREGRPSDDEILTARLIDRSIRPLFPSDYEKDVQVIVTVLSVDLENSPAIPAAVATSAALSISEIPWEGPVGSVRVGMKDDVFFTNPTDTEEAYSDLDLVVTATDKAIVMIEAGANEVPEEKMIKAIEYAQEEAKKIINLIKDLTKEVGVKKEKVEKLKISSDLKKDIKKKAQEDIESMVKKLATKEAGYSQLDELKQAVLEEHEEEEDKVKAIFDGLVEKTVRKIILSGKRPDGRKPDEIRELSAQVGVLPRTHGSAIFQRGQTQALSVTTLGSPSMEQFIETAEGEETKRYIHHYSMPPYSVGETGRMGSPSRREIGHGALAEKAILPMIPPESKFPYTIRVVSEILSSNGSTSMASVCGSTLSLMDAGVPIKEPVAGIAMGVVVESSKKFIVLTDIVGLEDGNGDMDFKVAGTKNGITALQLDVKTLSLTPLMLGDAMKQALKARMKILEVMNKEIGKPRAKVSDYAPKIRMIKIPVEKIGDVIGPGGKTIKQIIANTGAQVDVEDDGSVSITGMSDGDVEEAVKKVEALVKEVEPGEIYEGTVKRIQPFGAFVEVLPSKDGLVHVSDMSKDYVKDPGDVVSIGDKVKVKVKEIDDLGRINLTMVLDGNKSRSKSSNRGGRRRLDSRDRGGRKPARRHDDRRKGDKKSSGPHFPASRFIEEKNKKN